MSILASLQEVSRRFGPHPLFAGLTLGIHEGERVGLIGANGSGKSTLLKLLAGLDRPDSGAVSARRGLRTEYVAQAEDLPAEATIGEVLAEAAAGLPVADGERAQRAERLRRRAGLPEADLPVGSLSGGGRKRLALARALVREPDLLLLDEPTNHLDLQGIRWLEEELRSAPFACVAVTHDRGFLRAVTNRVIELGAAFEGGYLTGSGGYEAHVERRDEYLRAQLQRRDALAQHVRREVQWLGETAQARSTKQQARIRRAGSAQEDLADLRRRTNAPAAGLGFDATGRRTRDLIVAEGIAASRGGRALFVGLDLRVAPGVTLGIVGQNGSGKSTLLDVLTARRPPDTGTVRHAEGLRVVRFDQDRAQLDPRAPLREALTLTGADTVIYRERPMHIAAWAKRFLFRSELLEQSVGYFSGGEQARMLLARLMLQPADVLVLDEPTNDLDIATLEVLEEALAEFPGAVLLVTHDRELLDNLATHVLGLDGRGGTGLFADCAQWERSLRRAAPAAPPASAPAGAPRRPGPSRQRELDRVQERIEKAEARLAELRTALEDPAVASDHERLAAAWEAVQAGEAAVAELYTRWEELETRAAAAGAGG